MLPAIVASCAAYTIFVAITHLGIGPIWHFPQQDIDSLFDFIDSLFDFAEAALYGVIGVVAGWLFIAIFRSCERLFNRLPGPVYWKTTVAGFGLACLAILFPLTRFFGEHQLETVLEGDFTVSFLIALAIAKMLAISVTVTGGWRGGIIIPLFFTGACLGKVVSIVNPGLNESLAMIRTMAALNTTVTRTPISTTLLLAKLTGFGTFTPILLASVVGFFLAPQHPFIASQMNAERKA